MQAETISVSMPSMMPLRHVALGIDGFLGRQRQLLDGEEQPHGERQRGEHAVNAEREIGAVAFRQLALPSGRRCSAPSG